MPDHAFAIEQKEHNANLWAIYPEALDSIKRLISGRVSGIAPTALVPDKTNKWKSHAEKIGSTVVIHISGVITYDYLYRGTNLRVAARDFQEAMADDSINLIVFHFDTQGGQTTGVREFARMIYNARGKKKIVGYAQGMCASAGAWLYSACEIRAADPTALLGSVGVQFVFDDYSEFWASMGIRTHVITSRQSPMKNISPVDPKGEKAYEDLATELCAEFISDVALYTGVSEKTVANDFGRGFIMTGEKAVKVGMVDWTGDMADILDGTASLTNNNGKTMATDNGKPEANAEETDKTLENGKPTGSESGTGDDNGDTTTSEAAGSLEEKVDQVIVTNAKVLDMVEKIVADNRSLKANNEELSQQNADMTTEIEDLKAKNAELADQPEKTVTPKVNGMGDKIDRGW